MMEPNTLTQSAPTFPVLHARGTRWIGGVIRPHGLRHRDKPLRVAAWIDRSGSLVGAAIVEGHGPSVLRELLDELLARTDDGERPRELVVWPNARAAFRGLEYPPVRVERDDFLTVVIEDEVDSGRIPSALPVRSGCPTSAPR